MDIKTAKKSIKENIKGYKIQRSNEVLDITPFNDLNNMYYNHAPQIGVVFGMNTNASIIMGSCVLGAFLIYTAVLEKHYLTQNIETLRVVRSMLNHKENNPFEKYDENDDVVEIIKRNQKEKKLIK